MNPNVMEYDLDSDDSDDDEGMITSADSAYHSNSSTMYSSNQNTSANSNIEGSDNTTTFTTTMCTRAATTTSPVLYKKPQIKVIQFASHILELPTKYQIFGIKGEGAYGVVMAARDEETGNSVAIKKINNVFQQHTEYQKRILREIKILRHFHKYPHPNVIKLVDLLPPRNYKEFHDVYIVMEMMDADLRKIIKSPEVLTEKHIQFILYEILKGIKYVHSANVLHRDIKPSNVLLSRDMQLKICDFGLSKHFDFGHPIHSTHYVATRWWRSPELLLMYDKSSEGIDIWSVGVMFAEMLFPPPRPKAFLPGESYIHQLELILDLCGTPPDLSCAKGCQSAIDFLKDHTPRPKKNLAQMFPNASEDAIDLLGKMLEFDPDKRIKTEDALAHPFLAPMRDMQSETACPVPHQYEAPNKNDYKLLIYEEIMDWNRCHNGLNGDAIIM